MTFVPVILAGGSGERFWPLSTPEHPKQFLQLDGSGRSLLQSVLARLAPLVPEGQVYVQTSQVLADKTRKHLSELDPTRVLAEPARRDTGPAIAWSVLHLAAQYGDDAVLGYFPADQWIGDAKVFADTVETAIETATKAGHIVVLGITPTRPATEYGYIQRGEALGDAAYRVVRFTEKPDAETARRFLTQDGYTWNAGMFIARAGVLLEAFSRHAPEIIEPLRVRGDAVYETLPKQSIDYAVMEKSDNIAVVPAPFAWDDLGDWNALARIGMDVCKANVIALDSDNNVVYCDDPDETIAMAGIHNMVVVRKGKHTLIVPRTRIGEIKKLLEIAEM